MKTPTHCLAAGRFLIEPTSWILDRSFELDQNEGAYVVPWMSVVTASSSGTPLVLAFTEIVDVHPQSESEERGVHIQVLDVDEGAALKRCFQGVSEPLFEHPALWDPRIPIEFQNEREIADLPSYFVRVWAFPQVVTITKAASARLNSVAVCPR